MSDEDSWGTERKLVLATMKTLTTGQATNAKKIDAVAKELGAGFTELKVELARLQTRAALLGVSAGTLIGFLIAGAQWLFRGGAS